MKRWLAASLAALFLAPAAALAQAIPYAVSVVSRTAGVVATAGTFQVAKAQESGAVPLRNCQVTNTSANAESIDTGFTPSAATARPLAAGATFDCASSSGTVIIDQINVTSATAASTYVVWIER